MNWWSKAWRSIRRRCGSTGFLPGDRVRRNLEVCVRICQKTGQFPSEIRSEVGTVKHNNDWETLVLVEWDRGMTYYVHPDNLELVDEQKPNPEKEIVP